MVLYDMTEGSLSKVPGTTFKQEKVLERTHLQAAVREHIGVLGQELMVVAEEFGDWADASRRIDLLCIDKTARLVVVELKRTDDGGHMELQAIRYAAMVSVMTFDDVVRAYARFRNQTGKGDEDREEAKAELLDWFHELEEEEPVVSREVGIVLASADFSQEITTTVLWLNEFHSMDIRCVRLSPYRHHGRLLLDVQQLVPLPEASELTVRLRRRDMQAKAAKSSSAAGLDLTRYVVAFPGGHTQPLPKRRAILALIHELAKVGVAVSDMEKMVPQQKLRAVDGYLSDEELATQFAIVHDRPESNLPRWFLDEPVHQEGRTWVLSKQWGLQTESVLTALAELSPGFSFLADSDPSQPALDAEMA